MQPFLALKEKVSLHWFDIVFNNLQGIHGGGGSAGKESTCHAGDLGSIPGLEDPLEEGKATHSSSGLKNSMEFHGLYNPWGHKESDTTE